MVGRGRNQTQGLEAVAGREVVVRIGVGLMRGVEPARRLFNTYDTRIDHFVARDIV